MTPELSKSAVKLRQAIFNSDEKKLKYPELMFISGLCERTVRKCLRELRSKGFLAQNNKRGRITTHELLQ